MSPTATVVVLQMNSTELDNGLLSTNCFRSTAHNTHTDEETSMVSGQTEVGDGAVIDAGFISLGCEKLQTVSRQDNETDHGMV